MKTFDATLTLRDGMSAWPGDRPYRCAVASVIANGQGAKVSDLDLTTHTGTHVDAPAHMLDGGAGVDAIAPSVLVGPAVVVEVRGVRSIGVSELREMDWRGVERVLFKTAGSGARETQPAPGEGFVALEEAAARFLASRGILLVGVDCASVDPPGSRDNAAHRALLEAGIVIVEGLDLSQVPAGRYELFCGPLKVAGGDGAPARVFLREPQEPAAAKLPGNSHA